MQDRSALARPAAGPSRLTRTAEAQGWQAALYEHFKLGLGRGLALEDERMADWKYLLPLRQDASALVLGCGWGAIPVALAPAFTSLTCVDSSQEKVSFLRLRLEQQGIENVHPMRATAWSELCFPDESFDLVSLSDPAWTQQGSLSFAEAAEVFHRLLVPGGTLHLSVGNVISPFQVFRPQVRSIRPFHSLVGYRQILRAAGFARIRAYAPLPHYDGIPLLSVPLDSRGALGFFYRNLFVLFERVSPELKQRYFWPYQAAKVAARVIAVPRLAHLTSWIVPGFCIIADKSARGVGLDHAP